MLDRQDDARDMIKLSLPVNEVGWEAKAMVLLVNTPMMQWRVNATGIGQDIHSLAEQSACMSNPIWSRSPS